MSPTVHRPTPASYRGPERIVSPKEPKSTGILRPARDAHPPEEVSNPTASASADQVESPVEFQFEKWQRPLMPQRPRFTASPAGRRPHRSLPTGRESIQAPREPNPSSEILWDSRRSSPPADDRGFTGASLSVSYTVRREHEATDSNAHPAPYSAVEHASTPAVVVSRE